MRCWNCRKRVPKQAKVCGHCEADLSQAPDKQEIAMIEGLLDEMDPDLLAEFAELAGRCGTAEEFADRLLIGQCPRCGSDETGNCGDDPEIDDLTVGRCYQCGQMWCSLCERLFATGEHSCGCDPGEEA